jgi:hypothetical protein
MTKSALSNARKMDLKEVFRLEKDPVSFPKNFVVAAALDRKETF